MLTLIHSRGLTFIEGGLYDPTEWLKIQSHEHEIWLLMGLGKLILKIILEGVAYTCCSEQNAYSYMQDCGNEIDFKVRGAKKANGTKSTP